MGVVRPLPGVIHALVLLVIFLVLMPLAAYIPMACLAGVLVIVSYNMSGWRTFIQLIKNPKSDVIVLIMTFLLTVIFDLTIAIEVGLLVACLLFMKRMAESTQIKVIADEIDPNDETDARYTRRHSPFLRGLRCTKSMVLTSSVLPTVSRS